MKTIYDDYYVNMLMDSVEDPKNKRSPTQAQMFNEVSELIGIKPLAQNYTGPGRKGGNICDQYLLYMILKLGERIVDLENKKNELEL